jgi:DNA-binding MarR family transcriptional regulator
MKLSSELNWKHDFISRPNEREHEAVLNIYHTAAQIRKAATVFLQKYDLTDVQFNVMMLLHYQGEAEGLTQVELSRMMLVNRANVTALVDRMEKNGLVARNADPHDRRSHVIRMTKRGLALLEKVDPAYMQMVKETVSPLSLKEVDQMIGMLEKLREHLGK